jgi:hypothetical protein
MSNDVKINNLIDWNKWVEEAVSKRHIKYYEFEQFCNVEKIGSGGFGIVNRANWKKSHKLCAIKSFFDIDDATAKAIAREVKILISNVQYFFIDKYLSFFM